MPTEEQENIFKAAVVKVLDAGQTPIGTGFLVRWDLVATCAHVIKKALRGTTNEARPEGQALEVQFSEGAHDGIMKAEVVTGCFKEEEDVAFLRLLAAPPAGVEPLTLAASDGLRGQELRGSGFAVRDGLWMTATVIGPLVGGGRWQLSSTNISPGCSGGPLWNAAGNVVAMASSILDVEPQTGRHPDTCFGIGAKVLVEACPSLLLQLFRTKNGPAAKTFGHLNWLEWPVDRRRHAFRAYVVEPGAYKPSTHAAIFRATLGQFRISAPTEIKADAAPLPQQPPPDPFDLVTFPEAFLPADALLDFLRELAQQPARMGCIHTGLNATAVDGGTHLFRLDELRRLVIGLQALRGVVDDDLEPIRRWLSDPAQNGGLFNAGCLFSIDANERLRVCLHLKNVPSKYEVSPMQDKHMKEAIFFSLVTLRPVDKRMTSIVIQPLICSDVLELPTSVPGAHPITVLTEGALALDRCPPDHVDLVSVATCTPQVLVADTGSSFDSSREGSTRLRWRDKFCSSYERAVRSDAWRRHRHAVFILANFRVFPDGKPGKVAPPLAGLSGVFLPTPLEPEPFESFVLVDVFARAKRKIGREEDWMSAQLFAERDRGHVLGQLMTLDPSKASTTATALGFTISELPRDSNRWERTGHLVDVTRINIRAES